MCTISHKATVAFKDSASVADMLLGPLEVDGMREIPYELFEFINDTLRATYHGTRLPLAGCFIPWRVLLKDVQQI